MTNRKGEVASRFSARKARSSSPSRGWVLVCTALGAAQVQRGALELHV